MKNLSLWMAILLAIISCSPKYTASFQNYNRSYGEAKQVTNQIPNRENEISYSTVEVDSSSFNHGIPDEIFTASTSIQPVDLNINQPDVKSTELKSLSREEKKVLKKQIKSEVKSFKQEPKSDKPGEERRNTYAILGFIFSLSGIALGILFPPLLALLIPGMIFSILGLKSKKKGWAIAGLIIASVAIVLGAIVLLAFALADWG